MSFPSGGQGPSRRLATGARAEQGPGMSEETGIRGQLHTGERKACVAVIIIVFNSIPGSEGAGQGRGSAKEC